MVRTPEKDDAITQLIQEHIDCIMSALIEMRVDPLITATLNKSEQFDDKALT